MSETLFLRPHVQVCAVREDLMALDAWADAYLCIPGGVARLDWRPDERRLMAQDSETAAELTAAGLVQATSAPALLRDPPRLPARGLSCGPAPRLTGRQRAALVAAALDLARGYRARTFGQILDFIRRRPLAAAPAGELACEAASLLHAMVWVPAPGKCLARSFLLLRALQRCGHDCDWVFGVRTWPFGAHCWLQAGDQVLDDAPERLVVYQPIGAA